MMEEGSGSRSAERLLLLVLLSTLAMEVGVGRSVAPVEGAVVLGGGHGAHV